MATLQTFDTILKEFYIGPVQDQINSEVFALELFEKAVVDWNGKHCIIPVRVSRNSGVGWRGEGDSNPLPDAGSQGFTNLTVKAKYQYGRFNVTGPAISAAAKGSANSFISYVDAEMTHLVNDVRDKANLATISGGPVKGFIMNRSLTTDEMLSSADGEDSDGTLAEATIDADALVSMTRVDYDGDYTPFQTAVWSNMRTWVPVSLYRTDTLAPLMANNTTHVFVADGSSVAAGDLDVTFGENAGQLLLAMLSDSGAFTVADLNYGFDGIADPHSIAVVIKNFAQTVAGIGLDTALIAATAGTPPAGAGTCDADDNVGGFISTDVDVPGTTGNAVFNSIFGAIADSVPPVAADDAETAVEPAGIFTNLAYPDHHNALRSSTTNVHLLSTIVTCLTGAAGAAESHFNAADTNIAGGTDTTTGRADISIQRIQQVVDEVMKESGAEPDVILMSPLARQQYVQLLSGGFGAANGLRVDANAKTGKGSAGFLSLDYAGIPIHTSRAVPNGIMIFLSTDSWKLTELEKAGFADLDGNVLSRVSGQDAYEGYYRWYWNLVCTNPNQNAILCGMNLT